MTFTPLPPPCGLERQVGLAGDDGLGEGAARLEPGDPVHLVAGREPGDAGADGADDAGEVRAHRAGKDRPVIIFSWPCRTFQSIGFTAAALTLTATWPAWGGGSSNSSSRVLSQST
jgi:hypothetical protein